MKHVVVAVLVGLTILASCSPDEPLISNFDGSWRYLVSTRTGLATVRMPSGTIDNASIWSGSAPYPVQRLYEFRNGIYAVVNDGTVLVVDRTTLEVRDTLEVSAGEAITGLAFANATTAYIGLPDRGGIGVLDMTTNEVVMVIPVDGACTDLAALGNQVLVVHENREVASLIDTRTNTVEAEIALPNVDAFCVIGSSFTGTFAILCGGVAQPSDETDPLPSVVTVNVATRSVVASSVLTLRTAINPRLRPYGIAVNDLGFLYIPIQPALMFVNSRSPNANAAPLVIEEYHGIRFHTARAEFICIARDGRTIDVYDQYVEDKRISLTLPDSINAVIGIGPS
ncbi:MAG: YncE family protein [Candidatus Kapaibacteriota bacterium]